MKLSELTKEDIKKIILCTANFKTEDDLYKKFGEAVYSRIKRYCMFVKFEGEDYRIKDKI